MIYNICQGAFAAKRPKNDVNLKIHACVFGGAWERDRPVPTPPACGHTGKLNFFAINKIKIISLTPATRQLSIWTKCTPPLAISCLKTMRFWHCSPVATLSNKEYYSVKYCNATHLIPVGLSALAILAWPSTSSSFVGSSIYFKTSVKPLLKTFVFNFTHNGRNSASAETLSMASWTSQRWLASIIKMPSYPSN